LLAARELDAALADERLVSLGQLNYFAASFSPQMYRLNHS
jgi:hypothetical protein